MSREAFGDPPDPEPQRCPVCDGTEHTNDCELGEEMAKRQRCERELAEWREMALSQSGDSALLARAMKAETENALLHEAMRDEIDEGLRLRELGGALPDENITAMTERVIAERNALRGEVDRLTEELDSATLARMVADVVKRDAYRYRKLLMSDKHWLGVFCCDPDGTPSDSISNDELSARLDAMDGPEALPEIQAP